MSNYVEYSLDDGSSILVEIDEKSSGIKRTSGNSGEPLKASEKFGQALAHTRGAIKALLDELDALQIEEAEVKFGLKSIGEAGIGNGLFAIGKVGGEMNYEITIKWKKPQPKQSS